MAMATIDGQTTDRKTIDQQWTDNHLALLAAPLPAQTAAILGLLVADTVAIASHARRKQLGGTQVDQALVQAQTAGCSVWGADFTASASEAAFLNGCAAEALDFQEVLINPRNNGHAAVVIVPALLALAEQRGIGGERLLRALWIAFAANVSLAQALGRSHRTGQAGFRTTSLIAPIAASLGAAALISDDHTLALHAAAITATTLSAGLLSALSPKVGSYSLDKDLAVGLSARNALQSVLLAEAGATGPKTPLTGEHGWLASFGFDSAQPEQLLIDPLAVDLAAYAIKAYPACFGCQSAIRAALEGGAALDLAQVTRVRVEVNQGSASSLSTRVIGNHLAARFSLPYAVASALVRQRSVLEDFEPAAIEDAQVLAFMPRIEVVASPELTAQQQATGGFPAVLVFYQGEREVARLSRSGPFDGLDAEARQARFEDKLQQLCEAPLREQLLGLLGAPETIAQLFGRAL